MNRRDNQRGGVVVFAVVGILLVGLLAGALYVGKQRSEVAKQNAPKPIAIDTEMEATSAAKTKQSDTKASPPQQATKDSKPASTPSTPSTSSTSTTRNTAPSATPAPASVARSGPSAVVPATGPSDVALIVVVASVVTFVSAVFYRSNLQLRRSALSR